MDTIKQPSIERSGTLERKKGSLKHRYDEVLSHIVSPENIQSFYKTALNDLISVVDDVVRLYRNNQPSSPLVGRELEDEATRWSGVPDIGDALSSISERGETLARIGLYLDAHISPIWDVLIPPGEKNAPIQSGSGEGIEEKRVVPRLLTLLYILENDLALTLSADEESGEVPTVRIERGAVHDDMMRKHPYFRVEIASLRRVAYLCDEEGNASYIFDTDELERLDIRTAALDDSYKTMLNETIQAHPTIGRRLVQQPSWRERMIWYLSEPFDEQADAEPRIARRRSDFGALVGTQSRKEGWVSTRTLVDQIHAAARSIRTFAEPYRATHPEWFEIQRSERGPPRGALPPRSRRSHRGAFRQEVI